MDTPQRCRFVGCFYFRGAISNYVVACFSGGKKKEKNAVKTEEYEVDDIVAYKRERGLVSNAIVQTLRTPYIHAYLDVSRSAC